MLRAVVLLLLLTCATGAALGQPRSALPQSLGCGYVEVTAIKGIPPISAEMDVNTREAYRWLDSVIRRNADPQWNRLFDVSSPDTIHAIEKRIFAMRNYDPALLAGYAYTASTMVPGYSSPSAVLMQLEARAAEVIKDSVSAYLLALDYILHVRVESVTLDSERRSDGVYTRHCCVFADVLDTLKGRKLPESMRNLTFTYAPGWRKNGADLSGEVQFTSGRLHYAKDAMGLNAFTAGAEYLVFLSVHWLSSTTGEQYMSLSPVMDGNGGFCPIANGLVQDEVNRWHMGRRVPVSEFKASIRRRIEAILR